MLTYLFEYAKNIVAIQKNKIEIFEFEAQNACIWSPTIIARGHISVCLILIPKLILPEVSSIIKISFNMYISLIEKCDCLRIPNYIKNVN